ncbi:hypothetical protein T484DRAFT_1784401, partial [Baffinella frigidus]
MWPGGVQMSGDGGFMYAIGVYDNAVHTWSRDRTTGVLTYVAALVDDGTMHMQGPHTLHIAASGLRVFVACTRGHSIVVLARDATTGELTHLDSTINGERVVTSIATDVLPLTGGGGGGGALPEMAAAAKTFTVDGRELLIVAASDDSPQGGGGVFIMAWNATSGQYETEQSLMGDASAIDVDLFEILGLDGVVHTFLAAVSAYGDTN